jgi:hypothetical protein
VPTLLLLYVTRRCVRWLDLKKSMRVFEKRRNEICKPTFRLALVTLLLTWQPRFTARFFCAAGTTVGETFFSGWGLIPCTENVYELPNPRLLLKGPHRVCQISS